MKPEQAAALREPFPAELVGKLPKGEGAKRVLLDYVGHAAVTDRLLAVDPEWSWEPFSVDERGLPALDTEGNLWIRLTVCGMTRPGVGDGASMKVRIGDAIRNAAMRFGVALDLWAKEDLQQGSDPEPRPEPEPGPDHKRLHAILKKLHDAGMKPPSEDTWDAWTRKWALEHYGAESRADLTRDQMEQLIAEVDAIPLPEPAADGDPDSLFKPPDGKRGSKAAAK